MQLKQNALHAILHYKSSWNSAKTILAIGCRGVKKHGGKVKLNAHVDKILLEGKRASGVLLKDGSVVKARKVPLCKISIALLTCSGCVWHLLPLVVSQGLPSMTLTAIETTPLLS